MNQLEGVMVKYIWQEKAWPNFTWDNDKLIHSLSRCNFKRGQLLGRMASLGVELNLEAQDTVFWDRHIGGMLTLVSEVSPEIKLMLLQKFHYSICQSSRRREQTV